MATGIYKNGVAIIVTYQAVNCATGKTVIMDVYDESHAKDEAKCIAEMSEIGATGRYYATFTPDAEGEWIVIMKNTSDSNGEVVKAFAVAGHNIDSVGDAIAALNDLSAAEVNAEVDTAISDAALATAANLETVDTVVDGIQTDLSNETDGLGAIKSLIDTADTAIDGIQTDLSNGTDGLGAIKAAVDAIASPAMVG